MKKAIALLLTLLMVLSLAACGSQIAPEESGPANEQTEATAQNVEETEPSTESTEPVETEAPTEPEDETPAFDTSWAGDDYVMPIPAPPVTDFEINEFTGRFGGTALQISAQDIQDLTNDEIEAYRQTLESLGFVNGIYERAFDSEHGYEFSAKNGNEDVVYINCTSEYFVLQFEFADVSA